MPEPLSTTTPVLLARDTRFPTRIIAAAIAIIGS
jgi:hypothetical protein